MNNEGMAKLFRMMFFIMLVAIVIGGLWHQIPFIKNTAHAALDPTFGALMNWNIVLGTLIVFAIISFITTIIQKYTTDQEALRELKKEQKEIQKEMQKYKDDPAKMLEVQKNLMPTTFKMMSLTMKSSMFTIVPFILLFRWFGDYFATIPDFRFFGVFSWFWMYLISVIIFSSIFRKVLKVA